MSQTRSILELHKKLQILKKLLAGTSAPSSGLMLCKSAPSKARNSRRVGEVGNLWGDTTEVPSMLEQRRVFSCLCGGVRAVRAGKASRETQTH
jgi:hypothetical protein